MEKIINVAVSGALGRMGRMVVTLLDGETGIKLGGALERADHPSIGKDIGIVLGLGERGVKVSADIGEAFSKAVVSIDFSYPAAVMEKLSEAMEKDVALVIGTTGFGTEERKRLDEAAQGIPLLLAPNMSKGVNLLFAVVQKIASILGEEYDVEIVEAHHRHKRDAPSGTARRLCEAVARAKGKGLEEIVRYDRHGSQAARIEGELGVHAVRGGEVVGDHLVSFMGPGENIEITHRALNRDLFARGAIDAAKWLVHKPPGMYDMLDVLGIK